MSKTQLQTNNSKFSELITKLQGKAAGGGSDGISIASLEIGTEIYLMEDALTPYIIIAKDHHKTGTVTLMRKYATEGYSAYHSSTPSLVADNIYGKSYLKTSHESYYNALPQATKSKICIIDLPVRSSAASNYTIATVSAHMFPLSEMEYTGSGVAEGSHIAYFSEASKRIAYNESGTARATWTRTVTGGMNTHARQMSTSGSVGNQSVTSSGYLRPACCVESGETVTKDSNGNYILGDGASGGTALETCAVTVSGCRDVFYTSVENGAIVAKSSTGTSTSATHNIVVCKNSTVACGRLLGAAIYTTGAELLSSYSIYYGACKVTADAAAITINNQGASID